MDARSLLQTAIYKAQDRMGDFLKCGNRLLVVKSRLAPYLKSDNTSVARTAQGLTQRVDGMLAQLEALQKRAITDAGAAADFKAQLDKDVAFAGVGGSATNLDTLGSYAQAIISGKASKAVSIAKTMGQDALDMDAFIKATGEVESAVPDLDDLAAGKGLSAKLDSLSNPLSNLFAGLGSDIRLAVGILAVGAAVYLFFPSVFGRSVAAYRRAR